MLASLLLHALALLWLTLRPASAPPPVAPRPLELVVIEVAPAPPPSPPPAPRQRPARPAPAFRPRAPAAAPAAPPVLSAPAPSEALASDVPRAAPAPDAPSRKSPGGLVLLPTNPRFELPAQLPESARASHGIPEAPRQRSAQELVSEVAEDVQGQRRAELGAFHPYFTELGKALLAAWHPEEVVGRSKEAIASQRGLSLHDTVNAYRERAAAYGRTGSAFSGLKGAEERSDRPAPANGPLDAAQYTTGYVAMSAGMRAELEKKASAQVRLVQDREGRLLQLELVKASAHPEVDRLALEDLRRAGLRLPVPPPEALGLRNRLVSTWELAVHPVGNPQPHSSRTFVASLVGLGWSKHVRLLSGL